MANKWINRFGDWTPMCIRNNYKFANFRWGLVVNLAREKSQNLFLFACNKTTTTRTRMRSQCLRVGRGRSRDRYRGLGHELVALAPRCMETWILDLPMVMQSLSLIQSLFLITSLNHLHGESNGVASVHSLGSRNWDQQSAHLWHWLRCSAGENIKEDEERAMDL